MNTQIQSAASQEKIYLPIGANYVEHWGFWEATREILQNAIDTKNFTVSKMESSGVLKIKSLAGAMDLSTLMLGESSKRDDADSIGKYGEGYKLALLVLCRLGYKVLVKNGFDCWRVSIEMHPQLRADCLTVDVFKDTYIDDGDANEVSFMITGLAYEDFDIIENNYLCMDNFEVMAENEGSYCFIDSQYEDDPKKVFVGGLFVCDLPENDNYHYSYNFAPNILELDRDRKSVDDFYLQYHATKLLSSAGEFELLAELANSKATDISDYYEISSSGGSYFAGGDKVLQNEESVQKFALEGFIKNHGEKAYPLLESMSSDRTKAVTEQCIELGLTPVTVTKALYDMLPAELKKISPVEVKDPISKVLEDFMSNNKKHMRSKANKGLLDIIKSLKINGK